jgi:hypothetical protein
MDAPALQFALGRFFFAHRDDFEREIGRNHEHLRKRLAGTENMRAALGRRLEHYEIHHRPPVAQQRRHRDGDAFGRIGIEARMGLESQRQTVLGLEVDQYLIGVELLAEGPERRPFDAGAGVGAEVAVEHQLPIACRNAQFVVERIKQLDAVGRAFGEGNAVPRVFMRALPPGRRLSRPPRNFHLGAPRRQTFLVKPAFDGMHVAFPHKLRRI